jgi:hypothetical protein
MHIDNPRISLTYISSGDDTSSKVIRRLVRFDLPFLIHVTDSFQEASNLSGFVEVNTPFLASVQTDKIKLRFLKKSCNSQDKLINDISYFSNEFFGNTSKNTSYTSVIAEIENVNKISFSNTIKLDKTHENANDSNVFINKILYALNSFLISYKIKYLKYYIPKITSHSIGLFYVKELLEDGGVFDIPIIRNFGGPTSFHQPVDLDSEKQIQGDLDNGYENYLHELFAELWHKLLLQSWRSAAIDSAILFEAWLVPFLKSLYAKKGLSKTTIKNKFKTGDLNFPMGISEICQKLVEDASGYAFQNSSFYEDLINKTINLRNKLVHGVLLTASKDQAYDSMNIVIAAIDEINTFAAISPITKAIDAGTLIVPKEGIIIDIPDFPFPDASKLEPHLSIPPKKVVIKPLPNGRTEMLLHGFKEAPGYYKMP